MTGYGMLAGLVVLVGVVLALVCLLVCRPPVRWWIAMGLTMVILLVLTLVFDSLMITVDLFRFSDRVLAGPRIGVVPIGDLSWPIAVSLGLPSLWHLLGGSVAPGTEAAR
ncbi:MAG: lycopene cyclase domain-containing protein [Propionibacteriaceae bacterium]